MKLGRGIRQRIRVGSTGGVADKRTADFGDTLAQSRPHEQIVDAAIPHAASEESAGATLIARLCGLAKSIPLLCRLKRVGHRRHGGGGEFLLRHWCSRSR